MKVTNHSGVKKPSDIPKFRSNYHGRKGDCMHYMLAKCSNPNCQFYNPPGTEIELWYAEAIFRTISPGLDHIMKQGLLDIQMEGTKCGNY